MNCFCCSSQDELGFIVGLKREGLHGDIQPPWRPHSGIFRGPPLTIPSRKCWLEKRNKNNSGNCHNLGYQKGSESQY